MRIPAEFVPRRSETRERRCFVTQILSFGGTFLGAFSAPFGGEDGPNLGPNIAHIGNKTQPPPENRPWRGNLESIFPIVKSIWPGAKRAEKIDDLFPKAYKSSSSSFIDSFGLLKIGKPETKPFENGHFRGPKPRGYSPIFPKIPPAAPAIPGRLRRLTPYGASRHKRCGRLQRFRRQRARRTLKPLPLFLAHVVSAACRGDWPQNPPA